MPSDDPKPDYPEGDYEVGYKKPPVHTRFQKGQSGNPRGRPRGSKNLSTLLIEALDKLVVVTENGKRRKIAKRELGIAQLVNKFAMGPTATSPKTGQRHGPNACVQAKTANMNGTLNFINSAG